MAAKKSAAAKPAAEKKQQGTKDIKGSKAAPLAKEKSLSELTSLLAERTGMTKVQAKAFLDAHAALLIEELKSSVNWRASAN